MFLEILCIITLMSPVFIEWYEDRNGDRHPNNDWIFRLVMMVIVSAIVSIVHPTKNIIQAFALSFGMFSFLFPYGMNYIHYRRRVIFDRRWWDYLNDTAIPDKWILWQWLHWSVRMLLMAILLGACVSVYHCWGKIFNFNNPC